MARRKDGMPRSLPVREYWKPGDPCGSCGSTNTYWEPGDGAWCDDCGATDWDER